MHRSIIILNYDKPQVLQVATQMEAFFSKRDIESFRIGVKDCSSCIDLRDVDLAVVLGGDGTVLSAARMVSPFGIPIFPVNLGTLGFITEVSPEDWPSDLELCLSDGLGSFGRLMFQVQVLRGDTVILKESALNEVAVSGGGISKLLRLGVTLKTSNLGTYKADGMIVATPTGSTAYSMAAGGPILQPDMEAMILNPICPFTLSHRPIVLPGWEQVSIQVEAGQRTSIIATVDGQIEMNLSEGDVVRVSAAPYKAQIFGSNKRSFYDVLRYKLNWSGGTDAGRTFGS